MIKLPRKDLPNHLEVSSQKHLELLEAKYNIQQSEFVEEKKDLTAKYENLKERLDKGFPIPPTKRTMTHFSYFKQSGKEWFSSPFYTDFRGYKLCLQVVITSYVEVWLCMMMGEFDNYLRWPYFGTVTVEAISKVSGVKNKRASIRFYRPRNKRDYQNFANYRVVLDSDDDHTEEEERRDNSFSTEASRQLLNVCDSDDFVKDDSIEFCITEAK